MGERFLVSLLCLFVSAPALAAVGRHTQTALASRDIGEYETLSEENLISNEGYQHFRGCVATHAFSRGSIVKPEDIACLGPST